MVTGTTPPVPPSQFSEFVTFGIRKKGENKNGLMKKWTSEGWEKGWGGWGERNGGWWGGGRGVVGKREWGKRGGEERRGGGTVGTWEARTGDEGR